MTRQERRKLWQLRLRDIGMFGIGAWAFINETMNVGPADPWVMGFSVVLMGGPAVVNSVARAIAATRSNGTEPPQLPSVLPPSPSPESSGP